MIRWKTKWADKVMMLAVLIQWANGMCEKNVTWEKKNKYGRIKPIVGRSDLFAIILRQIVAFKTLSSGCTRLYCMTIPYNVIYRVRNLGCCKL